MRGEPRHHRQVLVDPADHRRSLDLYHDFRAVEQFGAMDLGNGRRRQWVVIDRGKDFPCGRPSSSMMTSSMTGHGSGGTWSRHHLILATSSGGKIPSPEATICPSLM